MELPLTIADTFLELFSKEIECDIPDTNSKLNLHILRIENNAFCYDDLCKQLSNHFISFALSRNQIQEFIETQRYGELYQAAAAKFRDYKINDGEAGELLLFCFLEAHLKAPKILTKLEIKLNTQDYAKGSDGIHLLKVADREYHLIFGESKLRTKLVTALTDAFKSIHDFITRPKSNLQDEIGLLNSQLFKETYDENLYQFLKSVIMPKANSDNPIVKNNAFAILAGFEISLTEAEQKIGNAEFSKLIKDRVTQEVQAKMSHIKEQIDLHTLYGYTFYVYVIPFIQLDSARKDIIKNITSLS